MKKRFVIIDAMALAYKAYFAFINRPLKTSGGEPTSAVFGFVNQLIKILEDTKPDYLSVAFDSKEKTFRHDKYELYKSTRAKMPDDMIPQLTRIKDIIEAMTIPLYILPGYEADDIIGTAVQYAEKEGLESLIITPDKDFNQLITDSIRIVKAGKSTDEIVFTDKEKFIEEFSFEPQYMIDYLALIGDSSDDIPGVAGIGPVSAKPLIKQYKTIENLYDNIISIEKKGIQQKLIDGKDNAFLSKELATIHLSVPFEIDFEKAKIGSPDFTKLESICNELEFRNIFIRIKNFFSASPIDPTSENGNLNTFNNKNVTYKLITEKNEAESLLNKLSNEKLFVFDTETDSLDTLTANLAGVSFSVKENEAWFVALNPESKSDALFSVDIKDRLDLNYFIKLFKPLFENEEIKKVCQNGKYDIAILRSHGIDVNNFYFDTMIASYVLDPDQKHGMDELAQKYLSYNTIPLSDLIGKKKNADKIFEVDVNLLSDYACEDSDITYRLYSILSKKIEKEKLAGLCFDVEFPLITVLEDMEREGICIDKNILKELSNDLLILLDNYTKNIYELAGTEFNINSPKQMQEIIFEKLGMKKGKKTKTGYSTDAKSLEALKGEHEIIDIILDYRQVAKLKSTYADTLPKLIHPLTGRVHTSFNQTIASTGRLSSNEPNLQNIPIRTELGKEIRKAFVPRSKDYIIMSADYSQIELRIMASMSGDKYLIDAFQRGEDIHRSTAALVFMVKPEEVTPDMRRKAKEVNFGILYGIGAFGLKNRLGVAQQHAKEIIETYFNTFKNVKSFIDETKILAKEKEYAETLLGRRRYLHNINSNNAIVRSFEERVAVNMPIQGTAADMIKLAMINIHRELNKMKVKTKMVLQVHDELVFDAHRDEIDELRPFIKKLMEEAFPLEVPIVVDTGIGDNWLDAH